VAISCYHNYGAIIGTLVPSFSLIFMTFYLYTAHLIPLFDHFQSTIYHLVQEASSLVTSFINAYSYKNNVNCDLGFLSKKPLAMCTALQ